MSILDVLRGLDVLADAVVPGSSPVPSRRTVSLFDLSDAKEVSDG